MLFIFHQVLYSHWPWPWTCG